MAIDQNFGMVSGDSKVLRVQVKTNGVPVNITSATIVWKMALTVSSTVLLTKSVGSGITITNAKQGIFEVVIATSDTAGLAAASYYHEAQLTDTSSNVSTVMRGNITMAADLVV